MASLMASIINEAALKAKAYRQLPIVDDGEPLAPLSRSLLRFEPPPYQKLGAPYGDQSPWMLRGKVAALVEAVDATLATNGDGLRLMIFDAFRPVQVQQFMVEHSLAELATAAGHPNAATLPPALRARLAAEVALFWATPSPSPDTPPPHSTGACIDLTLAHADTGAQADLGSPIDEMSPRSHPDAMDSENPAAHALRCKLRRAMEAQGFVQHPREWWHFGCGDQLSSWVQGLPAARYGRAPGQ